VGWVRLGQVMLLTLTALPPTLPVLYTVPNIRITESKSQHIPKLALFNNR